MSRKSIQKSVLSFAAALLLSAGLPTLVSAQDVSPVESFKNTLSQPVAPSAPGTLSGLQAQIEAAKGDMKWKSLDVTNEGLVFSRLELKSSSSDRLKAQRAVLSGVSETGGVYTIQSVEMTDFVIKGDDKSVIDGGYASYGPFTLNDMSSSAIADVLYGLEIPEKISAKNLSFKDKTNEFEIDFIAWGPSPSGAGSLVAIENMRGTAEDKEFKDPMEVSLGQAYVDGLSIDGGSISDFSELGRSFTSMDADNLDFRTASVTSLRYNVDGLVMDMAGADMSIEKVGSSETTRVNLRPARLNGRRVKDKDIKNMFDMLGEDEIAFQGNLETVYNQATRTVRLQNSNLEMIDWFNFDLEYHMSNVDEAMMMAGFGDDTSEHDFTFDKAKITMMDNSGVDRVIGIYAAQQGISQSAARGQATLLLGMMSQMTDSSDPVTSQLITDFSSAATKVLKQGGGITMSMDPEPGLTSKQLDALSEGNDDIEILSRMNMRFSYAPN